MRGFLATLMVLGIVSAVSGILMLLAILPDATKPAVVFVPQLIAGEVMTGLGLLLAATAGGLAEVLKMLAAGLRVSITTAVPQPGVAVPGADYVNPRYAPSTVTGADGVARMRHTNDWSGEPPPKLRH
jgi:hypothetical protein